MTVIKTNQLMLYRENIAVCSKIHTKHTNALRGKNVELLNVMPGGTNSDHWVLMRLKQIVVISSNTTMLFVQ
jgi:hypothetical protein